MSTSFIRKHEPGAAYLGVECAWPSPSPLGSAPRRRRPARLCRVLLALSVTLALGAAWQFGRAGYIHAKAWLAQALIEEAWARTRAGEVQSRPWPWADTWPVARLLAPAQRTDLYVLAGADGRAIAFGPGHMFGTPAPGEAGNSVIGAHRDTHFAFLRELRDGDPIEVETPGGRRVRYRVVAREVVDRRDTRVLASDDALRELTLVTCYPFDALRAGGPLRYVVRAREDRGAGRPS